MSPTAPPELETQSPAAETSRPDHLSASSWLRLGAFPSLPESFRTVQIPPGATWLRKILAFAGPGYLVAVGYMDPGNWATGCALLSGVPINNIMEGFLNFPLNADFQLKLHQRTLECLPSSVSVRV